MTTIIVFEQQQSVHIKLFELFEKKAIIYKHTHILSCTIKKNRMSCDDTYKHTHIHLII